MQIIRLIAKATFPNIFQLYGFASLKVSQST